MRKEKPYPIRMAHPIDRRYLLPLILLLPACQGDRHAFQPPVAAETAPSEPTPAETFDHDTVQTYDVNTRDFQEQAPYGARSNRSQ
jgi:hypothetical protein